MFKILIKTINLCLQWNSVPPLLAAVMKCVHGCVHPCFFSQTLVEELSIWHGYFYKDSKFNTIDNLESNEDLWERPLKAGEVPHHGRTAAESPSLLLFQGGPLLFWGKGKGAVVTTTTARKTATNDFHVWVPEPLSHSSPPHQRPPGKIHFSLINISPFYSLSVKIQDMNSSAQNRIVY